MKSWIMGLQLIFIVLTWLTGCNEGCLVCKTVLQTFYKATG